MSDFSVSFIPLDQIVESAHNPWHGRDDVTELADSIAKRGVQQPILLRPRGDGMLELVFGHRRARAAKAAGLTEIPARIRELTDEEAVEEQLTENAHRTDVHPIDEGELLQRLIQHHGYSVEQCAARLKMSRSWVYDRLRLAALHEDVKASTYAGALPVSVATVLAALPRARQAKALKVVAADKGREAFTVKATREWMQRSESADLDEVGWKLDETIVSLSGEKLGACSGCMFHQCDAASILGLCLDLDCFGQKREVANEREFARLRKLGAKDLPEEAASECGKWRGYVPAPWMDAFSGMGWGPRQLFVIPDGDATPHSLVGDAIYPILYVGRDREGNVLGVVTRDDLYAALKAAGFKRKDGAADPDDDDDESDDDDDSYDEDESEEAEETADSKPAAPSLIPAILAYVRDCPRDRPLWASLAELALETLWDWDSRTCVEVARSCGYVEPEQAEDIESTDAEEALHAWAMSLSEGGLAALVMAAAIDGWENQRLNTDMLERIAARFGIEAVQTLDNGEEAA